MLKINYDKNLDYDHQVPPPGMREIIFVKGSSYEMGLQYGKYAREMIKRNFCLVAGDALKFFTKDEIAARVELLISEMEEKTPDICAWWKGIADGAGMTYGEVALINLQLWLTIPGMKDTAYCSSIAATKSATADGKTIAGVNGDVTFNMSGYGVTVVAFPDKGHSFITLPSLAGQLGGNFAMNEKGLVVTFDGGGLKVKEHRRVGYADFISAMVYVVSNAGTAEEANEIFKSLGVGGGWIFMFADSNKNIMITEHTSLMDHTRYPGDHGEKDYIHAANHYISEGMKDLCAPAGNEDSWFRYDAEEQLLRKDQGDLTLEKMMDILACKSIYDGEKWSDEHIWEVADSFNTPEMGAPDFRTGTRGFGVTEDATAYVLHGTAYAINSFMPESTGKYCKIPLLGTMNAITRKMEEFAVMETWALSGKLYGISDISDHTMALVDKAKRHVWIGKNYLSNAAVIASDNEEDARKYYGLAASEFSYAYITAQLV